MTQGRHLPQSMERAFAFGIAPDAKIVEHRITVSAAGAKWMENIGHDGLRVLNGVLRAWAKDEHPVMIMEKIAAVKDAVGQPFFDPVAVEVLFNLVEMVKKGAPV